MAVTRSGRLSAPCCRGEESRHVAGWWGTLDLPTETVVGTPVVLHPAVGQLGWRVFACQGSRHRSQALSEELSERSEVLVFLNEKNRPV